MRTTIPTSWALYVIFICSFIIIFLTRPVQKTSDWVTYSNPQFGVSFSHPPEFILNDSLSDVGVYEAIFSNGQKKLYLSVDFTKRFSSSGDYLSGRYQNTLYSNTTIKPIKIKNIVWYQINEFYNGLNGKEPSKTLVTIQKGFAYSLYIYNANQSDEKLLTQMRQTFKFTDLTRGDEIPNSDYPIIQIGQPTPSSGCYYLQVQCVTTPCDPVLVCPQASPTCRPRPGCLDQEPRCLMPETEDMCPPSLRYICPETEWVDCMPGPGPKKPMCQSGYLAWAQESCPGFKGAAY